jgi:hypothetical protein
MVRVLSPWLAVLASACGRFGFELDPGPGAADGATVDGIASADGPVTDADLACSDPPVWYQDQDGDGHGNPMAPMQACDQPDNTSPLADDCDDTNRYRYPGAAEVCDGFDNDCSNGTVETCLAMCVPRRRPAPDDAHRYLFCGNQETWTVARTNCATQGYQLTTVDTDGENVWLASTAQMIHGTVQHWIGANDVMTEGTWRWPDDTTFWQGDASGGPVDGLYSNWRNQEPNDSDGMGEDCAELLVNQEWNDTVCIGLRHYSCELE